MPFFWTLLALLGMFTFRVAESTLIETPSTLNGSIDTYNEESTPRQIPIDYPQYGYFRKSFEDDFNNRNLRDDVFPPVVGGTVYIPGIITSSDPNCLKNIAIYDDEQCVTFFDRRVNNYISGTAHIFEATFTDGLMTQFWVSSTDFVDREEAADQVLYYATYLGHVPQFLRTNIRVFMIMSGNGAAGGNSDGHVLYHTGDDDGEFTGNVLAHEGAHVTTDDSVYVDPDWIAAVAADPGYISTYARDYPETEDNAESIVAWLGVKRGTLSSEDRQIALNQIPNRLAYYDNQNYNLFPIGEGSDSAPEGYVWEKPDSFYYPCGEWEGGRKVVIYGDTPSPTESPTFTPSSVPSAFPTSAPTTTSAPTSVASGSPAKKVLPVVLYLVCQLLVL